MMSTKSGSPNRCPSEDAQSAGSTPFETKLQPPGDRAAYGKGGVENWDRDPISPIQLVLPRPCSGEVRIRVPDFFL